MLGAIAGCGRLPLAAGAVRSRDPRRRQGGRQQSARLPRRPRRRARQGAAGEARRDEEERRRHPSVARAGSGAGPSRRWRRRSCIEGVRRLVAYQSVDYARLYLDRLHADPSRPTRPPARTAGCCKEVARHLAVRMSYEDVMRVAQAKIAPARMARIAREELRVNRTSRSRCTISSSPASRNCASCCRRSWRGRSCASPSATRLARPRLFRHGDQFHLDHRLSAFPDARQAARAAPLRPPLRAGAEARSKPGSR